MGERSLVCFLSGSSSASVSGFTTRSWLSDTCLGGDCLFYTALYGVRSVCHLLLICTRPVVTVCEISSMFFSQMSFFLLCISFASILHKIIIRVRVCGVCVCLRLLKEAFSVLIINETYK